MAATQSVTPASQLPLMPPQPAAPQPHPSSIQLQGQGLPQPHNPVLAAAFYQAVRDENGGNSGVNMDDIRNMMMSQDRSAVHSRNRNAPQQFPDPSQQQ